MRPREPPFSGSDNAERISRSAAQVRTAVSAIAGSCLQAHAAPAALAHGSHTDQLDARCVERFDQLHERVDIAADHAVACLHSLNRGKRKASHLGQLALIDSKQSPRSPQLRRRNNGCQPPSRSGPRAFCDAALTLKAYTRNYY